MTKSLVEITQELDDLFGKIIRTENQADITDLSTRLERYHRTPDIFPDSTYFLYRWRLREYMRRRH